MRANRPALEHDMFALLHQVAGKLPDQTVATARAKLAAGNSTEVAHDIAEAFVRNGLRLWRWPCAVLVRAGAPASVLTIAARAGSDDKERYLFDSSCSLSAADRVAIGIAQAEPPVRALWRAVRRSGSGAADRVYVTELGTHGDPISFTHQMQQALTAAGEAPPRVEAYGDSGVLPSYQRLARSAGDLLWQAPTACGRHIVSWHGRGIS